MSGVAPVPDLEGLIKKNNQENFWNKTHRPQDLPKEKKPLLDCSQTFAKVELPLKAIIISDYIKGSLTKSHGTP